MAKDGNDITNTGAGDTVYIREGTYEETLCPTNSGTAGKIVSNRESAVIFEWNASEFTTKYTLLLTNFHTTNKIEIML